MHEAEYFEQLDDRAYHEQHDAQCVNRLKIALVLALWALLAALPIVFRSAIMQSMRAR